MKSFISSLFAIAATLPIISAGYSSSSCNVATVAVEFSGDAGNINTFIVPFEQAFSPYNGFNISNIFYDHHVAFCVFSEFVRKNATIIEAAFLEVAVDGTISETEYAKRVDTIFCVAK